MIITTTYLAALGACSRHVALFESAFPVGLDLATCDVDATAAAIVAAGLNVGWAAEHMITATAWAEYERVTAPARAEYERVSATALAEYERVRAPAWSEYERVRAPALAEYERVRAIALITAAREHGIITPTPKDTP